MQLQFKQSMNTNQILPSEDDSEVREIGAISQQHEQQLQYLSLRHKSELSLLREKYEKQVLNLDIS